MGLLPIQRALFFHTVKRGDTLYDIAKAYGTTTYKLAELNGIRRNRYLSVGTKAARDMIDLEEEFNFTNKRKHPTNYKKIVYRHLKADQSQYFAQLLEKEGIDYETQVDEEDPKKPHIFWVGSNTREEIGPSQLRCHSVSNRRKFIDSVALRWIIIFVSVFVIALAILGALVSQ